MLISTKQQFGSKTSPRAPVIFVLVYVQKINLEWKKILFYEKVWLVNSTFDEVTKKTKRLRKNEECAKVKKNPTTKARSAPDELRLFFLRPLERNRNLIL